MATKQKECPACALDVDAEAEVCPYCGYEFPDQKKGFAMVALILAVLLALWVFAAAC